ncbi:hypothetical protein HCH_04802 [Hahella chejuensis KCTC 2396]|uniref:Uncharacterized protein n=1 Tax=Hahella chejuensis (strain KCTC 2396) TaxID=349521 RepID=Q2SCX9_HAHCH|nr:hypothetical protein HCH_04802 [Hahella chejuensis KCTC 2396]
MRALSLQTNRRKLFICLVNKYRYFPGDAPNALLSDPG